MHHAGHKSSIYTLLTIKNELYNVFVFVPYLGQRKTYQMKRMCCAKSINHSAHFEKNLNTKQKSQTEACFALKGRAVKLLVV